ncbi:unnamed protein product, partial [marine sediment metagenome]
IDSCTIYNCYKGVCLYDACRYTSITNNTIYGCQSDGVYLYINSAYNTISGNAIYQNGRDGIHLYNSTVTVNTFSNNIVRDNARHGCWFNNCQVSNIFTNETYYGNAGCGLYVNSRPGGVTVTDSLFGITRTNTSGDIGIQGGTQVILKNCLLDSPTEVYWATAYATNWVRSYKHDQVAGAIKIWGDYLVSGTETWNDSTPTYTGAGDATAQKIVTFGPGATGLNDGKSLLRIDSSAALDMSNSDPSKKTLIAAESEAIPYSIIISGKPIGNPALRD